MEIKPQYEHSKYGNFMFNLCAKWTKFLAKRRWLYYFLACTWGCVSTLLGLLISAILGIASIFSKKVKFERYGWIYCVKAGPDYWGGFEMGLMFVRDQESIESLNMHETGHSIGQITLFGVFFFPLIGIPSMIRWWARELFPKKNWKPYDAIWFEDSATQCGRYLAAYIENREK